MTSSESDLSPSPEWIAGYKAGRAEATLDTIQAVVDGLRASARIATNLPSDRRCLSDVASQLEELHLGH